MKNFLTSLVLLSSLASVMAFAEVDHAPVAPCDLRLRLSDSQRLEIKELSKASAQKLINLGKEIQAAKIESDKVLEKIESSKEEASQAAAVIGLKMAEIQAVKHHEKLAILFDVLTPEQRLIKVKCEKNQRPEAQRVGHSPRRPQPHGPVYRPLPHRPGRIEYRPQPHHRPGGVIISRPIPRGPTYPQVPSRPRRGGGGFPVI